jgi:hypothetical protein
LNGLHKDIGEIDIAFRPGEQESGKVVARVWKSGGDNLLAENAVG